MGSAPRVEVAAALPWARVPVRARVLVLAWLVRWRKARSLPPTRLPSATSDDADALSNLRKAIGPYEIPSVLETCAWRVHRHGRAGFGAIPAHASVLSLTQTRILTRNWECWQARSNYGFDVGTSICIS